MAREWTPQQKNAIESTGGTVLVSAAAGSGKTAVLVERVIRMITSPENPVDADRLLVVTFTRDAAAEVKQRIARAINDLLETDPYNPQLLRQSRLLHTASISTIDTIARIEVTMKLMLDAVESHGWVREHIRPLACSVQVGARSFTFYVQDCEPNLTLYFRNAFNCFECFYCFNNRICCFLICRIDFSQLIR